MKALDLIAALASLVSQHGNLEVYKEDDQCDITATNAVEFEEDEKAFVIE